jgi:diguanylate cyclase (GGDEF)-like protein/PAS domain S-box-containing protein
MNPPGAAPITEQEPAHWLGRVLPFVLAVAVAVAGMVALARLRAVEHQAEERRAAVATLRASLYQLEGSYASLSLAAGDDARLQAAFANERRLRSSFARQADVAYPTDGHGATAHGREVRALVADVTAAATRAIAAWEDGDTDRVKAIAITRFEPVLGELDHALAADVDRLVHAESDADAHASLGTLATVGTMLLLFGAIGVTSFRRDRRRARAQRADLAARERWFRALIEESGDVVLVLDRDAVIRFVGPGGPELLGVGYDDVIDHDVAEFMFDGDSSRFLPLWADLVDRPGGQARLDIRLAHTDGSAVEVEAICRNLLDDPVVRGIVGNVRDVTSRRSLEQQLVQRAFRDELTGLPNRAELVDRLEHALSVAARTGERVGVLFLDLDGFKTVNDTLGHAAGDELLVTIAQRLRKALRPADTAARLAGDEFVVIVEEVDDELDVLDAAARIVGEIARPTSVRGQELRVGVSVGVAFGDSSLAAGDLLRRADTAMYEAKVTRRGSIVLFEPEMAERAWRRLRNQEPTPATEPGGARDAA